jgi:biotin carboxyl carrier protein
MNELVAYIDKKSKKIEISNDSEIYINSEKFQFNLLSLDDKTYLLKVGDIFFEIVAQRIDDEKYSITVDGVLYDIEIRTSLQERAKELLEAGGTASHKMEIKAPMPGMILKVNKQVGEEVISGESIIILEAMKMENELRSPVSGKLKELFVKEGSPVEKGFKLFSIES